MGVIYQSPDGQTVIIRDSHHEAEDEIRESSGDPADWTVELTPITRQINPWVEFSDPGPAWYRMRLTP